MSDAALLTAEIVDPPPVDEVLNEVPASESPAAEPTVSVPPETLPLADQRANLIAAVQTARDLPPGVRERLMKLVEQAGTLDAAGEPLLTTRGVLDLLAQGLPALLRRETPAAVNRLEHPAGDAFFTLTGEELTDQQAEQIARLQLQRAGMLRSDK